MYKNSNSVISGTDSKKAKSEKKDCVVKAIASSTNIDLIVTGKQQNLNFYT